MAASSLLSPSGSRTTKIAPPTTSVTTTLRRHDQLQPQEIYTITTSSAAFTNIRCCRLYNSRRDDDDDGGADNDESDNDDSSIILSDLLDNESLVSDLFAIIIASELMGLLDSINDPTWQGWLSEFLTPISNVPETISTLTTRFSMLSLIWITSNVMAVAAAKVLLTNDTTTKKEEDDTTTTILPEAIRASFAFCVFRIFLEIILNGTDPDFASVLQDCYLVPLTTTAFRYIFGQSTNMFFR